jgi:hypothetical protein
VSGRSARRGTTHVGGKLDDDVAMIAMIAVRRATAPGPDKEPGRAAFQAA